MHTHCCTLLAFFKGPLQCHQMRFAGHEDPSASARRSIRLGAERNRILQHSEDFVPTGAHQRIAIQKLVAE